MCTELFGLGEFLDHLTFDDASENDHDDDHERDVAEADQREDRSIPKRDTESSEEHRHRENELTDLLPDTLTDALEVLGDLRGKSLHLLLFKILGLLLE